MLGSQVRILPGAPAPFKSMVKRAAGRMAGAARGRVHVASPASGRADVCGC